MLVSKKLLPKLHEILKRYDALRFEQVAEVPMELQETGEYNQMPQGGTWRPVKKGDRWGGEWVTGWFRGIASVPERCSGRRVFLHSTLEKETSVRVDGRCMGAWDDWHKHVVLTHLAKGGQEHEVLLEAYAWHWFPGTMPNDVYNEKRSEGTKEFPGVYLMLEREDVTAFVMDLRVLLNLTECLDEHSLRRGQVLAAMEKIWARIHALPQELDEAQWRPPLEEARRLMKPLLEKRNGPTTPLISLVGHSHLDTAWLWPIAETRRKAYRTYATQVNLMERYPEMIFIQSSPVHGEYIRQDQPELFERIKELVKAGRWEPNGGAWVEPDCNLTSGESLVRQFLYGIQWTREHFDYQPDIFWQPDVFGYSAALPQILRGFNIPYFCTTKMAWNDTTRFPYDTFRWQGLDGTTVLGHLFWLHFDPEPKEVLQKWTWAQHKDSETQRLAAYGWGDGGGGPTMESLELARRVEDLEGIPRTRQQTASAFMKSVDAERTDWPLYVGELYLELHRGTLTSIAPVKRGNRLMEMALRDAEFLSTMTAVCDGMYPQEELRTLWKELLVNQFHDILPGSSIARVNDEAIASFERLLKGAEIIKRRALEGLAGNPDEKGQELLLFNTLGWERAGILTIPEAPKQLHPKQGVSQAVETVWGGRQLLLQGPVVPALGGAVIAMESGAPESGDSPFYLHENTLETPHGTVRFDQYRRITSYVLKESGREVVRAGGCLNGFTCGEDVPALWDNWDIDVDQELHMKPVTTLVRTEVAAQGPLQLRLRQVWKIGRNSELRQDMIFHADSPMIAFETEVDWDERHLLLKANFDVDVLAETARHETQFGFVHRPTHRNYPQDAAKFEVATHKWSDLSDEGFGVAVLNDCKYGISVHGGTMGLSLLKSGRAPDDRGDRGTHRFTYAILPHQGGFSVEKVARPAWELNSPLQVIQGTGLQAPEPLFQFDSPSVLLDTVKWAESGDAFIIRLYEAGHQTGTASLRFSDRVDRVAAVNLMEEEAERLHLEQKQLVLNLKPFQISTLKCFVQS